MTQPVSALKMSDAQFKVALKQLEADDRRAYLARREAEDRKKIGVRAHDDSVAQAYAKLTPEERAKLGKIDSEVEAGIKKIADDEARRRVAGDVETFIQSLRKKYA